MEGRGLTPRTDPGADASDTLDLRLFTREEAQRTLPLVRSIVRDILETYPELQRKLQEFERIASGADLRAERHRLQTLREAIDRDAGTINRYIAELHQIGCVFKGFEEGLVDFHAVIDGQPAFLCWRYGEESIAWWHPTDTGFAGRRPLPP